MISQKFWGTYILLAICQALICNYVNLTPIVTATLLPALIMCIPLNIGLPGAMLMAFLTGLFVDFTADTVLGLNALALVPVALCRDLIMRWILGSDAFERKDNLTFKTKGFAKIAGVTLVAQAIFLLIYIIADGAGTRPFLFNVARFVTSMIVSWLLSLMTVELMAPETKHI